MQVRSIVVRTFALESLGSTVPNFSARFRFFSSSAGSVVFPLGIVDAVAFGVGGALAFDAGLAGLAGADADPSPFAAPFFSRFCLLLLKGWSSLSRP